MQMALVIACCQLIYLLAYTHNSPKKVLNITRSAHLQLRLKLLEHFFIAIKHVNVYLALYALHPPVGA